MVVYDVTVNGQWIETIRPINQRPQEMYWFMVDQIQNMRKKYGTEVAVYRRFIYPG